MSDKNQNQKLDIKDIINIASRYILQGLTIAVAAYYVPLIYKTSLRKPTFNEIFAISLTAAFTMFILDQFTLPVGAGARLGVGFTIGQKLATLM